MNTDEGVFIPSPLAGEGQDGGKRAYAIAPATTRNPKLIMTEDKYKWLKYIVVGTELAFSVIGGLLLGQYIDGKVGTQTPWFTLIGLIAGVAAGLGFLIRMTRVKNGDKGDESG